MDKHSAMPTRGGDRNRHLDQAPALPLDPPESSGASVAEHCSGATTKDRCHPSPMATELRPADGVDTALNPMQPPSLDPVLHCLGTQPQSKELPPSDNPMLRSRQTPDLSTQLMSC